MHVVVAYNFHPPLNSSSSFTLKPPSPRFSLGKLNFIIPTGNGNNQRRISRMAAQSSSIIVAQASVAQQQNVTISSKYGKKLVGFLHDTGSKEIVVLCHGFRSTKEDNTIVNLAVALENEGISAFRFDFAGNWKVDYRVTEERFMDRLNTDVHKACLMIDKECRVLTVHGSADEIILVEDAVEFAKIIPNHKLHIVKGADIVTIHIKLS